MHRSEDTAVSKPCKAGKVRRKREVKGPTSLGRLPPVRTSRIYQEAGIPHNAIEHASLGVDMQCKFRSEDRQRTHRRVRKVIRDGEN
jgi:hypothetical protein